MVGTLPHTNANVPVCVESASGTVLQQILVVSEILIENITRLYGDFTCIVRTILLFEALS